MHPPSLILGDGNIQAEKFNSFDEEKPVLHILFLVSIKKGYNNYVGQSAKFIQFFARLQWMQIASLHWL